MLKKLLREFSEVAERNLADAVLRITVLLALVFSLLRFILQHQNEGVIRIVKLGLCAVFFVAVYIVYDRFNKQSG